MTAFTQLHSPYVPVIFKHESIFLLQYGLVVMVHLIVIMVHLNGLMVNPNYYYGSMYICEILL